MQPVPCWEDWAQSCVHSGRTMSISFPPMDTTDSFPWISSWLFRHIQETRWGCRETLQAKSDDLAVWGDVRPPGEMFPHLSCKQSPPPPGSQHKWNKILFSYFVNKPSAIRKRENILGSGILWILILKSNDWFLQCALRYQTGKEEGWGLCPPVG